MNFIESTFVLLPAQIANEFLSIAILLWTNAPDEKYLLKVIPIYTLYTVQTNINILNPCNVFINNLDNSFYLILKILMKKKIITNGRAFNINRSAHGAICHNLILLSTLSKRRTPDGIKYWIHSIFFSYGWFLLRPCTNINNKKEKIL